MFRFGGMDRNLTSKALAKLSYGPNWRFWRGAPASALSTSFSRGWRFASFKFPFNTIGSPPIGRTMKALPSGLINMADKAASGRSLVNIWSKFNKGALLGGIGIGLGALALGAMFRKKDRNNPQLMLPNSPWMR